ncbi:MAG TPA: trehalose-phosphatase [Mycobacteriales bacterium]|nr:trehalose-phosphatase [Mycobacteriales bacterium]
MLTEPATPDGERGLAAVLADPARAVVAVDFDGTLARIVQRPEDARAAPGAVEALVALAGSVGRCAVVTGRAAEDVVRLGELERVEGLRVLGHYGLEEWTGGELTSPEPPAGVEEVRRQLPRVLRAAPAGVHVEDKHHSLVVHTRPADDPAAALAALTPALEGLAAETGLETVPGRFVLEIRPPGVDKGTALRRLVSSYDGHSAVYVGDDLGDLAAFAAVEELRSAGGVPGVKVASVDPALDDAPRELAERADLVLAGPEAVVEWLTALAAAIGTG